MVDLLVLNSSHQLLLNSKHTLIFTKDPILMRRSYVKRIVPSTSIGVPWLLPHPDTLVTESSIFSDLPVTDLLLADLGPML
jgi:hypothetical protein